MKFQTRFRIALPFVLFLITFAAAPASPARAAESAEAQRDSLLKGVDAVAAPGSPGAICVFGPNAYVLIDGSTGKKNAQRIAFAGVANSGKGRVVLFGHDGFLKADALNVAQTGVLYQNLVRTAAGDGVKGSAGVVGIRGLADALKAKGIDAIDLRDWRKGLDPRKTHAVFFSPDVPANPADVATIRKFVDAGGTAVLAYTGWGWQSGHGGKSLAADHPASALLLQLGLAISGEGVSAERGAADQKVIVPSKAMPAMVHVAAAVDRLAKAAGQGAGGQLLKGKADAEIAQAAATALQACADLPSSAEPVVRLRALAADPNLPLPALKKPLREGQALARVGMVLSIRESMGLPADQIKAHPAAAEFPGAVAKDAPRVTRTLSVDTKTPRWHSTGLYAAPGEAVTLTVPAPAAGKGLRLRIGAHTDKTYHLAAWHRAPEISRAFAIDKETISAANPFGGLVYVDVPNDCPLGVIEVKIANAVEAPLFVLGKTDVNQWRQKIRALPAPWAEVATDKLIITLRADAVRTLDDPTAVLEHWNQIMDATATLAGWPLARKSPERMVADADISAGYMHSGYPIMTGMDVNAHFVDMAKVRGVDSGWGFYHEIGHNHQHPDWTFEGTGEVTVNLFTMHSLEMVCGATKEQSTKRALGDQARIRKYLAAPDFEKWKADPFLALAMYAQIRMEFGWEPFKKAIAEYRTLAPGERPKSTLDRHDQWMMRMSKATGKNLGPFFQAWGVPTSEGARKSVEALPKWMPEGM